MNPIPLDRFRTIVLADPLLQAQLARLDSAGDFGAAAKEIGARHALVLPDAELAAALRPDPLGIDRFEPVAPSPSWAPAGWLPVDMLQTQNGPVVDWAHFGGAPLSDPFYAGSIRRAYARPFNRLFRWQTPLADFVRAAEPPPPLRGLIFHWSRCGSTLAAQMLARLPGVEVLSEPAPLDTALRIGDPALVAATVAALARGGGNVVKLHCWHVLRLDLLRQLFPATPWVFLHRDPLEILVSHDRAPGPELVPQMTSPALFGLPPESEDGPRYQAEVLAILAESALAGAAGGGGLLIDYETLPEAVSSRILPHFGMAAGSDERAAMAEATQRDVKRPGQDFSPDGQSKREAASSAIRSAADRLRPVHERLRALS